MGDQAGNDRAAEGSAGKTASFTRMTLWKSAIVIAPLAATALFLASGTQAQTSGSAPSSTSVSANGPVAPIETAAAARRKGPKIKEKEATNDRVANPPATTDPATPAQTGAPVAPIDAPDAARRGGPKGGGRDKILVGRTEAPAPDSTPVEGRRREGPKGDEGSGRTAPTPAPDTQPTGRRKGPKGDGDHGRTATTPLLIGALGAAGVLALIVSGGNDRPASP